MSRASKSIFVLSSIILVLAASHAQAQVPCPSGSRDAAFDIDRDLQSCEFGAVEGNAVGAGHDRYYNVFCPGRMSMSQAVNVASALARNRPAVPGNPIPGDYARLGLEARYAFPTFASGGVADDFDGIHHLFHFTCGTRGVATHLKFETASDGTSSQDVADHCEEVNRAGSVRLDGRVDVEYHCAIHMFPGQRHDPAGNRHCPTCPRPVIEVVAALAASRDVLPAAQTAGVQTCLLNTSDIQCAPCTSSDKLVVRLAFVESGGRCPGGTTRILGTGDTGRRSDGLTEAEPRTKAEVQLRTEVARPLIQHEIEVARVPVSCAAQVQGKIAWNYSGNTRWSDANVARLCRGAETSAAPAACFDRTMHGGINWGGGTRWSWSNALDLCEGSTDAGRTLACFNDQLQAGEGWQAAIRACGK